MRCRRAVRGGIRTGGAGRDERREAARDVREGAGRGSGDTGTGARDIGTRGDSGTGSTGTGDAGKGHCTGESGTGTGGGFIPVLEKTGTLHREGGLPSTGRGTGIGGTGNQDRRKGYRTEGTNRDVAPGSSAELLPLHVAASRGCFRCLQLLLRKQRHPERSAQGCVTPRWGPSRAVSPHGGPSDGGSSICSLQDGKPAVDLALEQGTQRWHSHRAQDEPFMQDPGGARCSLSFLTEDGSTGSIFPMDGLLSSTRRSLLEEMEESRLSSFILASGDVTPQGQGSPGHCHITPRTKSRLRACAQRFSSSSSSSLFDETLEMPRRPPRLRAPQGVPRGPATTSGHCGTLQGEGGEGTASLDDTEILPRAPSQPSSPPGDSSSTSPTVLLAPGDPQSSPSDTRGSSSPTVLLVPGDQDSQSEAPRSPHDVGDANLRVLEGGSGWQDPSPLGPQPSPCPRRLSDAALRRRLQALGHNPGPITELTRGLYLRRFQELARAPRGHRAARAPQAGHSPELVAALSTGQVPDCTPDELVLAQQFDHPGRGWHQREGLGKTSFNYLLLDPRTTQNLPLRSHCLSPAECFRTFVQAIFYVGKGTRARPYHHLTEALSQHRAGTQRGCPKVRRILEIWASGQGVVSLHCFQSSIPAEAYTRENCLVEALGLQTITNQRQGNSYGAAARWPAERRRRLGVHLLHRAMRIFLAEGERQLRPADIQGGR
ncbi:ankyrin repeat and LEM domain-containing protein 1 [Indicator indicator]|uniref:ankyrin repeat and LEM domain-containing protein 1 n=1 Tax=Indicator indicator TaxID=1002788 RepID=UPI0023DF2B00|nr:ankyrin repeat and LEM domain-containing protein 1 [Indicator indicator]